MMLQKIKNNFEGGKEFLFSFSKAVNFKRFEWFLGNSQKKSKIDCFKILK